MLKILAELSCKINEREYKFHALNDSPTADAKDALIQFLKMVDQIEINAKEAQKKAEEEKALAKPETTG